MKFLPTTLTGWIAAVIGLTTIIGGIGAAYLSLQTEAEAADQHAQIEKHSDEEHQTITLHFQEYQVQQQVKDDRSALNRIEKEITDIRYDLLYGDLDEDQKEFWRGRLDELKADKECIRSGNCLE